MTPIAINWDTKALMDFKPFINLPESKNMDITQSSYKNNLEIINEIKLYTGYEFFLDTVGELIFKPPFYNVDTRPNEIYVIRDSDIISWGFSESEADIVTRVEVTGGLVPELQTNPTVAPRASYTNYNLARQFGLRSVQISMRFFNDPNWCYYHAISEMDRINSDRTKGSLTIIGRPELRLGLPVYIESRDCFGYVESISHNFSYGSTFTTEIQIHAIRRKYIGNDPLASELKSQNNVNPTIKGKAAILLFELDTKVATELLLKQVNKNQSEDEKKRYATSIELLVKQNASDQAFSSNYLVNNKFFKTNRPGLYKEYSLFDQKAKAAIALAVSAKEGNNQDAYLKFLDIAVPVSDENGYELIGTYENGRSLFLDSDGTLKKKSSSLTTLLNEALKNEKTNTKDQAQQFSEINVSVVTPPPLDDALFPNGVKLPEEISNFMTYSAKKLTDLKPNLSKNKKVCSCSDPAFYTYSNRVAKNKPKQKTIDSADNKA